MGFPAPVDFRPARALCAELQRQATRDPMDAATMGERLHLALANPVTRQFIAGYLGRALCGSAPDYERWNPPGY